MQSRNQKPRKGSHHVLEIKRALRVSTVSTVEKKPLCVGFAAGTRVLLCTWVEGPGCRPHAHGGLELSYP